MTQADVVEAALEPLWPTFDAAVDSGDFSGMTEGQRAVAFAWLMSGLVDNGGFTAWIESIGHRTREAQEALTLLGALEYLPLLDRAMEIYRTFSLDTEDARLSASEQWSDDEEARCEELDQAFYRLEERRDLVEHYATGYVTAHREEFSR